VKKYRILANVEWDVEAENYTDAILRSEECLRFEMRVKRVSKFMVLEA
jgi:hypothetical protein